MRTDHDSTGHDGPTPPGRDDIDVRAVSLFVAGLFATVAAVALVLWVLFGYLADRERATDPVPRAVAVSRPPPPAPRLQVLLAPERQAVGLGASPAQDLEVLRQAEDALLESYGWVDREAGIVHLPIERAMALYLERGPAATQTETLPDEPTRSGSTRSDTAEPMGGGR